MTSGATRQAGVMGWPLAHTLSPRLHSYWIRRHGLDAEYAALPVEPERLGAEFRARQEAGYAGWNLTVPHKEAALKLVAEADAEALAIGAVNTVVVRRDGSLLGMNTDAYGFAKNLLQQAGDPRGFAECALVLGAGGAARAVVHALWKIGMKKILLANRTPERAAKVAKNFGTEPVAWESCAGRLSGVTLLVNTTMLGMQGQPPLELPLEKLPAGAVVADIVYAPLETDLLKRARAKGCRAVTGLGMLIHQAVPGFAAWFGIMPEITPELEGYLLS